MKKSLPLQKSLFFLLILILISCQKKDAELPMPDGPMCTAPTFGIQRLIALDLIPIDAETKENLISNGRFELNKFRYQYVDGRDTESPVAVSFESPYFVNNQQNKPFAVRFFSGYVPDQLLLSSLVSDIEIAWPDNSKDKLQVLTERTSNSEMIQKILLNGNVVYDIAVDSPLKNSFKLEVFK